MKFYTKTLKLKTFQELEFLNITNKVNDLVKNVNIKEGFVNIFSKHTTLAIEINEYEKLLLKDIEWFLKKIAPENHKYCHDIIKLRKNCPPNEPRNGKGHLRSMALETFQIIPILKSKIQLGKYQQIFAVETSGPRTREIIIQILG